MNLHQYAKNQAFSLFYARDISQLKNTAIWLVESILDHVSETRIFPRIGFVQEYNNIKKFLYRLNSEKIIDSVFQ